MRSYIPLLLFLILLSSASSAQHEADNWYFGYNAGLSFATSPPTVLTGGQVHVYEGSSSISDAAGNLLFYSDGQSVWDRNDSVMPNGTGLYGNWSSTQSCLIVKKPGSANLYYVFTVPDVIDTITPMSYSIVDMTLNNGNGDVTTKNYPLFNPSSEKLTAVATHSGDSVWVIGHEVNTQNFYSFLLDSIGVNPTPVISSVGNINGPDYHANIGQMKVSHCGTKIASAVYVYNYLELFDFDISSGILSNAMEISLWQPAYYGVYGIEFSPDDSKFYVSLIDPSIIVQYDLLAVSQAAIIASADTVAISPNNFNGQLQSAPDGKIYYAKYQDTTLGCITNPNASGSACGYVEDYVTLTPGSSQIGLPNFVTSCFCNYNTGTTFKNPQGSEISIFPNPSNGNFKINFQNIPSEKTIQIFDVTGNIIYQKNKIKNTKEKINLVNNPKGIYFLKIIDKDKSSVNKIVLQ
ncbi:MAG TPA: T9SS type A sorting domain-containing protein [Bacteroidia bacterium]|nr:T9SS type A sorting domain-containing protein [Bacteroidia bacterium]